MKAVERIAQHYLLKQLPKPIALVDLDGMLVEASDSWLQVFSMTREQLDNTCVLDLYPKSGEFRHCLSGSKTFSLRHHSRLENGFLWYRSTFAPWFDEGENVIGSLIQTDDISSEVEKELELERLGNNLETISEVAQVGFWEYDRMSGEVHWCPQAKKIFQVPPAFRPNINNAIEFYKQGHDRNTISMLVHRAMEQGRSFNIRMPIITAKGEERWLSLAGKPINKNGVPIKLFGTFQDVHEQVMADTKVEQHRQLLTSIIDSLPLNIFVKDLDSRMILVNKAECDHLGKPSRELIGKNDLELRGAEAAIQCREEDLKVIKTLKPLSGMETTVTGRDGQPINYLTSKIPLFDLEGTISGIIGIRMDITSMKRKEDQLRNLIDMTSVQNKKLMNFAHIVSHNLRSHSANFSMLLKFLGTEKDPEEREHILTMLTQASDSLLETLDNLNQVVDINVNVHLDREPINLYSNIAKVANNLSAFLEKSEVEIVNKIATDLEVHSVPAYLDSIILNLLTNAVKYSSPERRPRIVLEAVDRDNGVLFTVSDNGIGLDLDRYGDKIFGMYKTFHNRKDAKGIGLYMIKNQIEAMGGTIGLESKVGHGSTFKVFFNGDGEY